MFLISFLSVAVITCALHAQGRRFEPGRKHIFSFCSVSTTMSWSVNRASSPTLGFHGVMVSTLDFESSDPSSNLGGTLQSLTPWRNGSASDSRSEGCVFESRRGQILFSQLRSGRTKTVCLQWGLNSWPLVYKTNALPLSYRGIAGGTPPKHLLHT